MQREKDRTEELLADGLPSDSDETSFVPPDACPALASPASPTVMSLGVQATVALRPPASSRPTAVEPTSVDSGTTPPSSSPDTNSPESVLRHARRTDQPVDVLWKDKIRVMGELGSGGMGTVLEGEDVDLRRPLALKVLAHKLTSSEHVARFVEEAQITAQLEHPNIVPVHEFGIGPDGRAFFTMKRIQGQSLEAILEKRRQGDPAAVTRFGLRGLLDVFLNVCQAIEYAHARGVIHRDLKPANIMVGEYGEVLVMDWGVARLLDAPDAADTPAANSTSPVPDSSGRTSAPENTAPTLQVQAPVLESGGASVAQDAASGSGGANADPSETTKPQPDTNASSTESRLSALHSEAGDAAHALQTASESQIGARPSVSSARADLLGHKTVAGSVLGTPTHMSPEQAKGLHVDERTDIYALGVILYEILSGRRPFSGNDPLVVMTKALTEAPIPPSVVAPDAHVPVALEEVCLHLLEKEPERRNVTIPQIRALVQDHIEGIARARASDSWLGKVLWAAGALGAFVFLVWYLTGQSISQLLAPTSVLNAVGWFLLATIIGYPLWSFVQGFLVSRRATSYTGEPDDEQRLVGGFFAHRRFAAAITPLSQMFFLAELGFWVIPSLVWVNRDSEAADWLAIMSQLKANWYSALSVILLFLFLYLVFLLAEARFARSIEHYEPVLKKRRWESVWPLFLVGSLLVSVTAASVLHFVVERGVPQSTDWAFAFLAENFFWESDDLFRVAKTFVFQGTLLIGMLVSAVALAFPFSEILAALRLRYQPFDEQYVSARHLYFRRSLAVYEIAASAMLYSSVMIGCLSTMTVLMDTSSMLADRLAYILAPTVMGYWGYALVRRSIRSYLARAAPVRKMLESSLAEAKKEEVRLKYKAVASTNWRVIAKQFVIVAACLGVYLVSHGAADRQRALEELVRPASSGDFWLVLPFVLLVPAIVFRDALQRRYYLWRYPELVATEK